MYNEMNKKFDELKNNNNDINNELKFDCGRYEVKLKMD